MKEIDNVINKYIETIDRIYGFYLDCSNGFGCILKNLDNAKEHLRNINAVEMLDEENYTYGLGHPSNPKSYKLYTVKIKEVKENNKKDGENIKLIANYSVLLIYCYWEHKYRDEISKYYYGDDNKKKIKEDFFGDLAQLRHCIIKKNGFISSEYIKNVRLIRWFKYNDEIFLDREKIEIIVTEVKKCLNKYKSK